MSGSMREKIARALYEATPFNLTEGPYERQSDLYKRNCLLLADAALYALMEPDATMMRAGVDASPMWQTDSPDTYAIAVHDVADIFVAMIQAAKDGK